LVSNGILSQVWVWYIYQHIHTFNPDDIDITNNTEEVMNFVIDGTEESQNIEKHQTATGEFIEYIIYSDFVFHFFSIK